MKSYFKLYEGNKLLAFGNVEIIATQMGWSKSRTQQIINTSRKLIGCKYRVEEIRENDYQDLDFEFGAGFPRKEKEMFNGKCSICGADAIWEYDEHCKSKLDNSRQKTGHFYLCKKCGEPLIKWLRKYVYRYENNENIE